MLQRTTCDVRSPALAGLLLLLLCVGTDDTLGRPTKRTLPGGQSESFTYDAVGNVATHVTFNGETIAYQYDAMNRLAAKTLPGGNTVSYTYTATGQVETVADARGVTRYSYDPRDRVTKVEHPEGGVVSYTYDAAGNRASMTTQWGTQAAKTTLYEYDAANRLAKLTNPENQVWRWTYDLAGNRSTATLPNGVNVTYGYDARNRLTSVEHRRTATPFDVVLKYEYTWNAQGLRATEKTTSPTEGTCTVSYTYDRLGRLTRADAPSACIPAGSWTYTYDAVGNRLTESTPAGVSVTPSTYTYDDNDRLKTITGFKAATYEYDAAGNVIRQTQPGGASVNGLAQVTEYRWDAEGRMVGLTDPLFQVYGFGYDADGQLVRQTFGTDPAADKVTYYLVDKNLAFSQVLEERDGAGNLKVATQFAETQAIKLARDGQEGYFHQDHLSTRAMSDAQGVIQASYTFSPFGELARSSGTTFNNSPAITNNQLFAGERFEPAVGQYYLRARWMDSKVGRFVAVDPYEGRPALPITLNDYVYAGDDPVDIHDPSGLMGLAGEMTGQGGLANVASAAANTVGRKVFTKFGCMLAEAAATEVVVYGIYVLTDGMGNFYVGQSNSISRRYDEHIRKLTKEMGAEMAKRWTVVESFFVQRLEGKRAAKDLLRLAEQTIIDEYRVKGNLTNKVNAIDKVRGRLRNAFRSYPICK